jgi:hypothetical protein
MAGNRTWRCAPALVAGTLALLGGRARALHAVLDQRAFASRAVGTLARGEVRDELVDRISSGSATRTPSHREPFPDDAHVAQLVIPGTGASVRADFVDRVRTSSPAAASRPRR